MSVLLISGLESFFFTGMRRTKRNYMVSEQKMSLTAVPSLGRRFWVLAVQFGLVIGRRSHVSRARIDHHWTARYGQSDATRKAEAGTGRKK